MKILIIPLLFSLSVPAFGLDKIPGDTSGRQLQVVLQTGHADKCSGFFSADDQHFFTYTDGGEIFEWETGSLRLIRTYLGQKGAIHYCGTAGKQLVTVSSNRISFWTAGNPVLQKTLDLNDTVGSYRARITGVHIYNDHYLLLQQGDGVSWGDKAYRVNWLADLNSRRLLRLPGDFLSGLLYVHPGLPLLVSLHKENGGYRVQVRKEIKDAKTMGWETSFSQFFDSTAAADMIFYGRTLLSPDGEWLFINRGELPRSEEAVSLQKTICYYLGKEDKPDTLLKDICHAAVVEGKLLLTKANAAGKLYRLLLESPSGSLADAAAVNRYYRTAINEWKSFADNDAVIFHDHECRRALLAEKTKLSLLDEEGRSIRFADFRVATPQRLIAGNSNGAFVIQSEEPGKYGNPVYWFWQLGHSLPEAIYDPKSPLIDSTPLIRLADTAGSNIKYKVNMDREWSLSYFRGLQSITLTDSAGKVIELSGHTGELNYWCIDSSQRWLASCSRPDINNLPFNEIKIWNIEKGYEYKRMLDMDWSTMIDGLRFSADGLSLWGSYKNKKLLQWEIKTGIARKEWPVFAPFTLTAGDSLLAAASDLGQEVKVYETGSRKILYTLDGHSSTITDLKFINGGKYLLSSARDGRVIIWNMENGSRVYDIIQLKDGFSYLLMTGENYYLGSREAMNELNFVWKDKAWSYEPFDLALNRPDLVLGKMGEESSASLLPLLKRAWNKRVLRAGLNAETAARIPELDQLPSVEVEEEKLEEGKLYLKSRYSSAAGLLDQQLRVNGVPVVAQGARSVGLSGSSATVTDTIELLEPLNLVQLYCRDAEKRESPRKTLFYELPDAVRRGRRVFIGVGVSDYRETQYHLRYPAKDVLDLAATFKRKKNPLDTSVLLINERATRDNILSLKKLLAGLKEEDEVVISFNGHGVVDSSLNFYFAPHDMVFADPVRLGLSYDAISDLLRSAPARKKLCLIDACHSGAFDKEEKYEVLKNSVTMGGERGSVITSTASNVSGSLSSFRLMQHMFNDLSDNDGSIILSAAGGDEVAFEGDDWKNGAFTYCIRNALEKREADQDRDYQVTVSELKNYVSRWVQALTGGRQQPMTRQDNTRLQWVLY